MQKERLLKDFEEAEDKDAFIAEYRELLHEIAPQSGMPIDIVRWVPLEQVEANNYNPNSVARTEIKLLQTSILSDGYTQPVVTFYDEERDKYVIVD